MNRLSLLSAAQSNAWAVRGCAFALWLLLTAVICALYLKLPPNPDLAVYDYIGLIVNQGGTLYVDVADQNWPGQMFIQSLSVWLFGSEFWSYRLFELIIILPASCFVLFKFMHYLGNRTAAWMVIPIYQVMYVTASFGMSGQREIVAGPFLIAAAYALLLRFGGGSRRVLIAQGAFIAAATLIRPTLLIMAPLLLLADFAAAKLTSRRFANIVQDHVVVASSIVAILGVIAAIGAVTGSLAAWYEVSILFNIEVYTGGRSLLQVAEATLLAAAQSWHWYIVWSLFGAILLWRRHRIAFILLIMVVPAAVISILVQGKGFPYHAAVVMPLMALLIAISMGFAWQQLHKRPRVAVAVPLVLLLMLPVAGLGKKVWGGLALEREVLLGRISEEQMLSRYTAGEGLTTLDVTRIANYVDATTPPGEPLLLWGRPCHVNNLTERPSPLFPAAFTLLADVDEDFSRFEQWQEKLHKAWQETPPSVLILIKDNNAEGYVGIKNGTGGHLSEVVTRNLADYQYERSFGPADIFRRIAQPSASAQ